MTGVILGGFLFIVKITLKTREVVLLFFLALIQSLSKADIINRGHKFEKSSLLLCLSCFNFKWFISEFELVIF